MSSNWAFNLDMLAQNGVLDYDAASFIMGQPPRYVGSPDKIPPFVSGIPTSNALNQPNKDEFKKQNDTNIVHTPVWKKWAFGLIMTGALVFGGYKFKSKLIPMIKVIPSKFKLSSIKNFFVNKAKSIGNFFKNLKTKTKKP